MFRQLCVLLSAAAAGVLAAGPALATTPDPGGNVKGYDWIEPSKACTSVGDIRPDRSGAWFVCVKVRGGDARWKPSAHGPGTVKVTNKLPVNTPAGDGYSSTWPTPSPSVSSSPAPATPGGTLPKTGSDVVTAAALAWFLAIVGIAMAWLGRRKRPVDA